MASNNMEKQRVAILMPMVWSIRNMVHSGVLDYLTGVDLHLLIKNFEPSILNTEAGQTFSRATSCQPLLPPPVSRRIKGLPFLKEVIDNAFSRRNKIKSYKIYKRWFHRNYPVSLRLRSVLIEFLGLISQPRLIFSGLYDFYNYLYQLSYDLTAIKQQLQEINPHVVLSTVNVEDKYERAYVLAAKELGIPLINSVVSFDNLSSKPAHMTYDHYFVWCEVMKNQLLSYYPQVKKEQICVTGTPQFDFHCKPQNIWSREDTLRKLGLSSEDKYFLYCASGNKLTPDEPKLVVRLAEKMQEHRILKNYWLVVRIHPLDDWSRWQKLHQGSNHVILSFAWNATPDASGWALPTRDDHARLTSSLVHSAACINIASTVTLDAAILDRPVIGMCLDSEPEEHLEILFEEYETTHYKPLVQSRGLRLAHTWNQLLDLLIEAIEHPDKDQQYRAQMVYQECGQVDGGAALRVANALIDYVGSIKG